MSSWRVGLHPHCGYSPVMPHFKNNRPRVLSVYRAVLLNKRLPRQHIWLKTDGGRSDREARAVWGSHRMPAACAVSGRQVCRTAMLTCKHIRPLSGAWSLCEHACQASITPARSPASCLNFLPLPASPAVPHCSQRTGARAAGFRWVVGGLVGGWVSFWWL